MKSNFEDLVLAYLSIYNESHDYGNIEDEKADNAPETCPTCESDIYDGECVNCGHIMRDEDNESEFNHGDKLDGPWNNYGHPFGDGDPNYLKKVDGEDDGYCPKCKNGRCVDKNGNCHFCNPEDDEPESGIEY